MMRKTPDCPKCGEDGLVLCRAENTFRLLCVECSWRVSAELVAGQDLDAVIAAIVKAETPIAMPPDPPHGFYAGTNPAYVPATDADDAA